jgi:hypothetical protein
MWVAPDHPSPGLPVATLLTEQLLFTPTAIAPSPILLSLAFESQQNPLISE